MQYQLNIAFDDEGLEQIYGAAQTVTLVRSFTSGADSYVAWVTFQPFENNIITWTESYYIYATTYPLQAGTSLVILSQTQEVVQQGWTYALENGMFVGAAGGASNAYSAENQQYNGINFGLVEEAVINGVTTSAPINGVAVLVNQAAAFVPLENVAVFLSSYSKNGVVLSSVPSNALVVTFTTETPVANVSFNDDTNTFYLVGTTVQFASQADIALR